MIQTTLWEKLTISVLWIFMTSQPSFGQDRKDQQLRFTGETNMVTLTELFKPLIAFFWFLVPTLEHGNQKTRL